MATLSDRLIALAQTIGADIKAIHHKLSGRLVVKDGSPINGWLPSNADDAGIAAGSIIHAGQSNTPVSDWTQMLSNAGASFGWQLASPWHHNSLYVRNRIATTFHPWRQIWDSGNSARLVTGDTDPGAIGAGAVWVRTSHPMGLHVRNNSNNGWIRVGGGMQVQKQQIFTTSGTFTPPPGMIAQGGHCEVFLVGGGQSAGGFYHGTDDIDAAVRWHGRGGVGGVVVRRHLSGVLTPQRVTIGAGGIANVFQASSGGNRIMNQTNGGDSTFGNLLTANGGHEPSSPLYASTVLYHAEEASSEKGIIKPRHPGVLGYGQGGYANRPTSSWARHKSGSGGGGSFSKSAANGASGICIVTWWESVE
ncbi:hypothetical protein CO615_03985 [Lysobacteraceae bacterium NML75-0749]|nr:hypothetical protein CO615_03985 [Xanthomonadaceae bacterium NML75-0749]